MKIIKGIGMALAMIGFAGIPGAIEFGNWIPTILFAVVGTALVVATEVMWHEER